MSIRCKLAKPASLHAQAFAQAFRDYEQAGEQKYVDMYASGIKNFDAYILSLSNLEDGIALPDGWVPETVRWLMNNERQIVGIIRVRHRLTPFLEESIGHIGYDVPPSCRKNGWGHQCMNYAIDIARNLNLSEVLITCDADNTASKRIIERSGAKFQNEIIPAGQSHFVRRYWLEL